MRQDYFDNLKVGDIVTHVDLPDRRWVIYHKNESLGGWDAVLQGSMNQFARVETAENWNLHSTVIERRRWYDDASSA